MFPAPGFLSVSQTDRVAEAGEILARVRRLCLAFPETSERLSHGSPAFFVGDKKNFVSFLDNHHDDGRLALWCAAPLGMQETLVAADPERFGWRQPPYEYEHDRLPIDVLAGSPQLRDQLERGVPASEIARSWLPAVAEFSRVRERFLLY